MGKAQWYLSTKRFSPESYVVTVRGLREFGHEGITFETKAKTPDQARRLLRALAPTRFAELQVQRNGDPLVVTEDAQEPDAVTDRIMREVEDATASAQGMMYGQTMDEVAEKFRWFNIEILGGGAFPFTVTCGACGKDFDVVRSRKDAGQQFEDACPHCQQVFVGRVPHPVEEG